MGRPLFLCGRVGERLGNSGSYSDRGGERGGGLSLFYGFFGCTTLERHRWHFKALYGIGINLYS